MSKEDHLFSHPGNIPKSDRQKLLGQKPYVIWFTGLSGSGKSSIANLLEKELFKQGKKTIVLDGDKLRQGLNRDLGFGNSDREENIRRIGELCRLFNEAGLISICSFISPFRKERDWLRSLFEPGEFIEVFVDTPIEICESRDPNGLYKLARAGKIKDFTGIDSPYEAPDKPELLLHAGEKTIEECVMMVLERLKIIE